MWHTVHEYFKNPDSKVDLRGSEDRLLVDSCIIVSSSSITVSIVVSG